MKKENFPKKICVNCGKPMTWRKKWSRVWDEVKYCGEKCRRNRRAHRHDKPTDFKLDA